MNLNNIQPGATILAPTYLHPFIRNELLKNKNGLSNVHLYSFSTYLKQGNPSLDLSNYEYYNALKEMAPSLKYNKESALSFSYISEVKNFITHLKQYHIDPTTLKEDNSFQSENKEIINLLYNIDLPIDNAFKLIYKKLNNSNFADLYIIDETTSLFQESIYNLFIEKGATRIKEKPLLKDKDFYYALNKRQEVESLAQYIITHKIDVDQAKLSILDNTYISYIHLIFDRYKIPYTIIQEKEINVIQTKFVSLLEYYLNPTINNLKQLFLTKTFIHPYAKEFITYLSIYNVDINESFTILKDLQISEDIINKYEVNNLKQLEKKAKEVKGSFQSMLNALLNTDVEELLIYIDTILCKHHSFERNEDRKTLLQIREEIKNSKDYIKNKDDVSFFLAIIKEQECVLNTSSIGLSISSLIRPLPSFTYHFVLGGTQSNYPNFKPLSGIFEESYYETLNYPSLEKRYNLHFKQLTNNLSTCEHLLCFYSVSTLEGKTCESSLELETFMAPKQAQRYPIVHNYIKYNRKYTISEEEAKQLFTKNNKLYGSISSLERYRSCPYSYFLRYALKLEEPIDYSFNNAKTGTLSHYIFETLVNTHHKDYPNVSLNEVEQLLSNKIKEIIQLYPNQEDELKQIQKRLAFALFKNLEYLKDYENHSSLTPSVCEYKYHYSIPFKEEYEIDLHGIIDRIDMNNDFLSVIDYKSSSKQLKEDLVFSGQQLQLITYLIIAANTFEKRALGCFYYSFANPNINTTYGKLYKRPLNLMKYTHEDYYTLLLKEKRLSGWLTSEYMEAIDCTGSHIVGVKNAKSTGISANTIYNFKALEIKINEIYAQIGNSIISGKIDCENAVGACTYCPYAQVCNHANYSYPKDYLINVDNSLYLKGGKKNEME